MNKLDTYEQKLIELKTITNNCYVFMPAEFSFVGTLQYCKDGSKAGIIFYDTKTKLFFSDFKVFQEIKDMALIVKLIINFDNSSTVTIFGAISLILSYENPYVVALRLDEVKDDLLLTSQLVDALITDES